MPGYVLAALHSFQHKKHKIPQDSPYPWTLTIYEKTIICYQRKYQLNNWINTIKNDYRKLSEIPVLCHSNRPHNVNGTKLTGRGLKKNNRKCKSYNSLLKLQRDASRRNNRINKKRDDSPHIFICILHIRTRGTKNIRLIFLLVSKSNKPIQAMPPENGPVHVECSIIINVTTSVTVSELGILFENFQKETSMRMALAEMGHQQPPTPVAMDNKAAKIIVNGTAKKKYLEQYACGFIGSDI